MNSTATTKKDLAGGEFVFVSVPAPYLTSTSNEHEHGCSRERIPAVSPIERLKEERELAVLERPAEGFPVLDAVEAGKVFRVIFTRLDLQINEDGTFFLEQVD